MLFQDIGFIFGLFVSIIELLVIIITDKHNFCSKSYLVGSTLGEM